MNWNSLLMRAVIGFITLFFLAYLVPGLTAFTYTHLLIVSLVLAFLTTAGENMVVADTLQKRSFLLFLISALTIYFYALIIMGERLPVVSALLTSALITVVDYFLQVRQEKEVKGADGVQHENQPEG